MFFTSRHCSMDVHQVQKNLVKRSNYDTVKQLPMAQEMGALPRELSMALQEAP